jgi:predicted RNase H-like HicB family nuclease
VGRTSLRDKRGILPRKLRQRQGGAGLKVQVGVEVDPLGQAMAWVAELPGCYARGRTAALALEKVPLAVYEYCAWLRSHGEELETVGPVDVVATETVAVRSNLGQAESTALFSFDETPVAGTPLLALRAAQYARADILDLLPRLHPAMLNLTLEGANRTLAQTLDHVILTDVWYTLRTLRPDQVDERVFLLSSLRDATLPVWAEAADHQEPSEVSQYADPNRAEPDQGWTRYKALRRLVWHDRLHYRQLARYNDRLTRSP